MQLCGLNSIICNSICILVIIPINFNYFTAILCGLHGVPVAQKHQMGPDVNISSLYYDKWLVQKMFMIILCIFCIANIILSNLGIFGDFALTGNDLSHSHSVQCIFLSQLLSPMYNLSF